jgi:transcriptional regulator with XRE-family HTH domain
MKLSSMKTLGAKFLLARKAKNITQQYIAKQIGIDQSQYQRIESGQLGIKTDKLIALCYCLDLDLEDLMEFRVHKQQREHLISQTIAESKDIKTVQRLAAIEIAKRDQIIHKLRSEIRALTVDF